MVIAAELYALQEIDSAIDVARATLAAVEEQLGETEELTAARAAVEEHREALRALHESQRDVEWQVDDARSHVVAVEKKLYGGTVRNPKELEGLNEDANMLKGQLRRREDELLNHMVKVEDQETALRQAEAAAQGGGGALARGAGGPAGPEGAVGGRAGRTGEQPPGAGGAHRRARAGAVRPPARPATRARRWPRSSGACARGAASACPCPSFRRRVQASTWCSALAVSASST